ncbi:NADPH:quinone reductase [Pedobacter frigiditerrae]|uniref:NADPH:quinone reductase n=1 Tax=Pedobacter frigiditerrae TaxID=2530452 RepID=A0A4R0MMG5_9SPHI|nr:zinc-dependent alcohol dehydrogenase family protein [Pedobacter frigiditerrae]TCC87918.1 NADPH:quinone reductase [Pedobacter frigiditerrae]
MNSQKTVRVVKFKETGSAEVLTLETVEMPIPKSHEILIEVKAIGLNRADVMYRNGMYIETPQFPAMLGYEASGIVESVGNDASGQFSAGDVVSIIPAFSLHDYATYGDYIIVPAYAVQKHPAKLSFNEAATLWTSYLSMYGILVDSAKMKAGDIVVINAASSATGLAAIQIVNYLGGISIALTTSASKKEALINAGAKYVVVTSEDNLINEIATISNGKGANIILDPVTGEKFGELVSTVAEYGKVYVYGILSSAPSVFPAMQVLMKTPTIKGYNAMEILADPVKLPQAIAFVSNGVEDSAFKPLVNKTFALSEIVEAHKYLESNTQFGKIVVIP